MEQPGAERGASARRDGAQPPGYLQQPPSEGYQFGVFWLSRPERVLLCDGVRVPLRGKVIELLLLLVSSPGQTLSRGELMDALWPDVAVGESSLPVAVSTLRRALSSRALGERWIETVPRRGYRFAGSVRCSAAPDPNAVSPQLPDAPAPAVA